MFHLLPCKAKIALQGKTNLGYVNFALVLKSIFGVSDIFYFFLLGVGGGVLGGRSGGGGVSVLSFN